MKVVFKPLFLTPDELRHVSDKTWPLFGKFRIEQWVQIISEVAPDFFRKKYETSHVCYDVGMKSEEIYLVKKQCSRNRVCSFLQK